MYNYLSDKEMLEFRSAIEGGDIEYVKHSLLYDDKSSRYKMIGRELIKYAISNNDFEMTKVILDNLNDKPFLQQSLSMIASEGDKYLKILNILLPLCSSDEIEKALACALKDSTHKKHKIIKPILTYASKNSVSEVILNTIFLNNKNSLMFFLGNLDEESLIFHEKNILIKMKGLHIKIKNESLDYFFAFVKSLEERKEIKQELSIKGNKKHKYKF